MKKALLFIVLIAVAVGAGYTLLPRSPQPQPEQAAADVIRPAEQESTPAPVTDSRYVPYSETAFARSAGKRRVYFFHAVWCPTCKAANEDFTANEDRIPSDVVVLKTDYDTQTELKKRYNITYQHTFVQVDTDGNQVAFWSGGGVDDLLTNLR